MGFVFTVIAFALSYSGLLYAHNEFSSAHTSSKARSSKIQCPPNEVYKYCLKDCYNCEQRGRCLGCASVGGCGCMQHFVRVKGPDQQCEPESLCPKPECGENEEYRACGPMCETCAEVQCHIVHCEYRCFCREGYMRNERRKCIPKSECPKKHKCSKTEERNSTGPVDEFCWHGEFEEVSNATQEREMCYCKPGHMRNLLAHCSWEHLCISNNCSDLHVFDPCPRQCNNTCRNYGDTTCVENGDCFPGCFCPEGLLVNDYGHCVELEDCPPGSNPYAPTVSPLLDLEPSTRNDNTTLVPTDDTGFSISTEAAGLEATGSPSQVTEDEFIDENDGNIGTTEGDETTDGADKYTVTVSAEDLPEISREPTETSAEEKSEASEAEARSEERAGAIGSEEKSEAWSEGKSEVRTRDLPDDDENI